MAAATMMPERPADAIVSLLERIDAIVASSDCSGEAGIFESQRVADALTTLMRKHVLEPADWMRYVHFASDTYTRNLIALGPQNRYGLMLLAWGPGQQSPIHDHAGAHCIMRILQGELVESLYHGNPSMGTQMQVRETVLSLGSPDTETTYIHDRVGWHRVRNASSDHPALSLHLYAPPIEQCQTYCEEGRRVQSRATCPYFSKYGRRIAGRTQMEQTHDTTHRADE